VYCFLWKFNCLFMHLGQTHYKVIQKSRTSITLFDYINAMNIIKQKCNQFLSLIIINVKMFLIVCIPFLIQSDTWKLIYISSFMLSKIYLKSSMCCYSRGKWLYILSLNWPRGKSVLTFIQENKYKPLRNQ
jgi:hypothetical protein